MVLPPGHKQQKELGSRVHTSTYPIPGPAYPHLATQEFITQGATKHHPERRGDRSQIGQGCLTFSDH